MAYDHNLRQKKNAQNAQKAAEETFEPKSKRDERILLSNASRATWLATFLVVLSMLGAYLVVDHFGTQGMRSGQTPVVVEKAQSAPSEGEDPAQSLSQEDSAPIGTSAASTAEKMDDLPAGSTEEASEALEVQKEGEQSPEALLLAEPLDESALETSKDAQNSVVNIESLPLPEEAEFEAQMTFYDEMMHLEVPLDDIKKYPIQFETPKYIMAGSFLSESRAKREHKRLQSHGQELRLLSSLNSKNQMVYRLVTKSYKNRRELNARMNELRALGARVRSYEVRN